MKKLVTIALIFSFTWFCTTPTKKDPNEGYIVVTDIKGDNIDDAELNAKRQIIANGLGELVEGTSEVKDAELRSFLLTSTVEGYVFDYKTLSEKASGKKIILSARGKVNAKAVQDALRERLKQIGKPRFMAIIDEKILGTRKIPGDTITEIAIASKFVDFDFVDKGQFQKIIAKEAGKLVGAYNNPSAEEKALEVAAELSADILVIGKTEVIDGGDIMGTGMHSYQSTLNLKIINVNTAGIIAAENSNSAMPHASSNIGPQLAVDKAVEKSYPKIRSQVEVKWKPGTTIRVVFYGIDYDDFLDKKIHHAIRAIKGVNAVYQRSDANANNGIVLEVEAMMNGFRLYEKMKESADLPIKYKRKEIKNNLLQINVVQ